MPLYEETVAFFVFAFGCFFVPFVAIKYGTAKLTWRNMELYRVFEELGVQDIE